MIVARIDNEITRRTPRRRGRSFRGALRYLLQGARDAPHPERVIYAETVNILSDISMAAHEMATTWESRFRLMAAAGISRKNGSDNTAPVYHAVISWRPDEDAPPPQEMAEHARQLLHLLGLGEHEAVLVVHGDTQNPHLHIIANTVHPVTGTTARLRFDKRIMQGFAARYEDMRGRIVCEGRFAPDARSAFNAAAMQGYSRRRDNRPRWARAAGAVHEHKRAALPSVILETLTRHHSTFSPGALAQAITAATISAREFSQTMKAVMESPELVRLKDERHATRYTTRSQQRIEEQLAANAARLAGKLAHGVTTGALASAVSEFATADQKRTREALEHLLDPRGLSIVVGYAGAGKSTLVKTAADAWTASGYTLRGLALAGRTAEALEGETGIASGTIAAFVMALENAEIKLGPKDILVIDEAGMVASHQLECLLGAAKAAGAKVVLIGDPEQLQAIEAGGPFRYLVDHYDHARLTTIWRQKAEWMQSATRHLAEGDTAAALATYKHHRMIAPHESKSQAADAILDMWLANRERSGSQVILTGTNNDARLINTAARSRLHALGQLGPEIVIETERGPLPLAIGDRVVFGRNNKRLKVKNGTTGTVSQLSGGLVSITVEGAPPRAVVIDPAEYPHLAHGYAVTIHKAQGATVDRAYVLAAPNMDRHSAYVALSRHRARVSLHWSQDVFKDEAALVRTLSRERLKDMTLDYEEVFSGGTQGATAGADARLRIARHTAAWAQLYETQRKEAALIAGMSIARRAFWYASNLDRLVRLKAVTWLQLHERERAALAKAQHRETMGAHSSTGAIPGAAKPKPSVAEALGLKRSRARRLPPEPKV